MTDQLPSKASVLTNHAATDKVLSLSVYPPVGSIIWNPRTNDYAEMVTDTEFTRGVLGSISCDWLKDDKVWFQYPPDYKFPDEQELKENQ